MKIQYAIDPHTGLTYSRIDNEVAVPVKSRRNQFGTYDYRLMKFKIFGLGQEEWMGLQPTDDLPASIRHYHKQFWNKIRKEDK
jgi:hypothetical protein